MAYAHSYVRSETLCKKRPPFGACEPATPPKGGQHSCVSTRWRSLLRNWCAALYCGRPQFWSLRTRVPCTRVLAHWLSSAQRAYPARTNAAVLGRTTKKKLYKPPTTRAHPLYLCIAAGSFHSPALGIRPSLLPTVYTPTS